MPAARFHRLAALLLFLGVLVVYWPLTQADYLNYDDPVFIERNSRLDAGLSGANLRWAFTANFTSFSPSLEYWSPLTALSRLVDVELWGKEPRGHHFTSLLLHGLSAVLLFGALARLTGRPGAALWVAAIFAFHPVSVEPVAWLSARKDVIYGLFWNLTLLAYAVYVKQPDRRRYLLLLGAFLLAAMSKPMVLTLPWVLLLLDYWPASRLLAPGSAGFWRSLRRPVLEKLPMIAVSLLLAWLAMFSQRGWNAVVPDSLLGLPSRLTNALFAYCEYLRLLVWPAGLSPYHPFVAIIPSWKLALSAVFLLALSGLALWQGRRRPWLAVGWFWFCGVLFPVSGIVQIGGSRLAERYFYVAIPGLALAIAWTALELADRYRQKRSDAGRPSSSSPLLAGLGLSIVLALSAFSAHRAWIWRQPFGVWEQSARLYPLSTTILLQYANAAWDLRDYGRAGSLYGRILRMEPHNGAAKVGLARLIRVTGDLPHAAEIYRRALDSAQIAQAQLEYAQVLAELGRDPEALAVLDPLCRRIPLYSEAWLLRARLQYRQGNRTSALASLEQAWTALRIQTAFR